MPRRVIKYQTRDGRLFDSMAEAEAAENVPPPTGGKQLFQIGFEFSASKSHQAEVSDREEAMDLLKKIDPYEYTNTAGIQVIGKPQPFVNILRR